MKEGRMDYWFDIDEDILLYDDDIGGDDDLEYGGIYTDLHGEEGDSILPLPRKRKTSCVSYRNLESLVRRIDISQRTFCTLAGRFSVGDIPEALIVENNLSVDEIWIATLSMSYDNLHSLKNIVDGGYLEPAGEKNLHIIVSDFFYAHERKRDGLIGEIVWLLGDHIVLSATRTHQKIMMFRTACGKHIVVHGSANMRSTDNIENICIEDCEELYYFLRGQFSTIENDYGVYKKSRRGDNLFNLIS